jgi:hypothetical protein
MKLTIWFFSVIALALVVSTLFYQADRSANRAPAETALKAWWEQNNPVEAPVKVGTRFPAHTITVRGRVVNVGASVWTEEDAANQAKDARFVEHRLAIVQSFRINGETVTVVTHLTGDAAGIADAEELCHFLGLFVWSKREFGLENIKVIGSDESLLASRRGLRGEVKISTRSN